MHNMEPNWEDLKNLLHLHRGDSLSGAARSLSVNYTTVARRLKRLEEKLGCALFQRGSEGYIPTDEGRRLIAAAEAMELQLNDSLRVLAAAEEHLSGRLRITAPPLLVGTHLAATLEQMRAEHPAVELEIVATNDLLNLNRPEADIAIRISNDPGNTLVGTRLARQHSLSYAAPRVAEQIEKHPDKTIDWIGMTHWKSAPKASLARYPNANIAYRFDDMSAAIGAAVCGLGVVRMPLFLGEATPGLVRVPVLPPQPYWDIWALTHKDMRSAAKVQAYKNILLPYFKSRQGDFWVS